MSKSLELKRKLGNIVIALLIVLPAIFWTIMQPISSRFASTSVTMTSLGQLTALLGMAIFSITLILSARVKFLEKYLGGQNNAYVNHHYLGTLSFVLLVFHPLFLIIRFSLISLSTALGFINPLEQDPSVLFGTMSLLLMIISLFFTFYRNLPYQIWKQTHRFLGLAFFFGGLHMFFIESDVSRYAPLKIYLEFLVFLGVISLLYRVVFRKLLVKTYSYIVTDIIEQSHGIYEIILKAENKKIKYKTGQFAFVNFYSKALSREIHPYTITSEPGSDKLSFVIKELGDYTNKLKNLKIGDTAKIEGPYGLFTLDSSYSRKQVWIAGGIGITPFLSMARGLVNGNNINSAKYSIDLYYSVKTEDEFVFLDELREISKKTGQIRVFDIVSERDGFVTADIVANKSGNINDVYICGPQGMMQSLREQFQSMKILSKYIHTEEFAL